MTDELKINGVDAWDIYGVNMGDGFIDSICAPTSMKDFVTSNCRLENGARVITKDAKTDSRDLTLTFTITGKNKADFKAKKKAFEEVLYNGDLKISIPPIGDENYFLVFQKCTSFGMSKTGCFCKISAKFIEPNPAKRTLE